MAHPLGDPKYVRFTTFRRTGVPVHTAVWFAAAPDGSYVFESRADSGKVKRLRHTSKVEVGLSDVRGRVHDDEPRYTGVAEIVDDADGIAAAHRVLARKYGLQWRMVTLADTARRLIHRPVEAVIIRTRLGDPV